MPELLLALRPLMRPREPGLLLLTDNREELLRRIRHRLAKQRVPLHNLIVDLNQLQVMDVRIELGELSLVVLYLLDEILVRNSLVVEHT